MTDEQTGALADVIIAARERQRRVRFLEANPAVPIRR